MKKLLIISLWILSILAVIAMLSFAGYQYKNRKCTKLSIVIDYGNGNQIADEFITYQDIQEFVNQNYKSIQGNKVKDINIAKIKKRLSEMAYVQKVDVRISLNGNVDISIMQRRPILRVIDLQGDNFYIDTEGKILPGRIGYSSRVVTANGFINDSLIDKETLVLSKNDSLLANSDLGKLYRIALIMDTNAFLKDEIVQLYINETKEIEMIPLVGSHTILFGDANSISEKLEKLQLFYLQGIRKGGWNSYKTINLKFKDQIVCTKNSIYGTQ